MRTNCSRYSEGLFPPRLCPKPEKKRKKCSPSPSSFPSPRPPRSRSRSRRSQATSTRRPTRPSRGRATTGTPTSTSSFSRRTRSTTASPSRTTCPSRTTRSRSSSRLSQSTRDTYTNSRTSRTTTTFTQSRRRSPLPPRAIRGVIQQAPSLPVVQARVRLAREHPPRAPPRPPLARLLHRLTALPLCTSPQPSALLLLDCSPGSLCDLMEPVFLSLSLSLRTYLCCCWLGCCFLLIVTVNNCV